MFLFLIGISDDVVGRVGGVRLHVKPGMGCSAAARGGLVEDYQMILGLINITSEEQGTG